ncbi:MAG: cob(I)yrinic acid a,c-diamide adenosyltransferase [Bacteroidia bacterium]
MKIYTKTGDKGQTSLLGGTRVPKHHIRIEAYGTVDELNSWIGLLRDQTTEEQTVSTLLEIQDRLFTMGSSLASDPAKSKAKIPDLKEDDITLLEKEIDRMNEHLPEMKSFVLPGGHPSVSYCHIGRCVCRRAERAVLRLGENEFVAELVVIYLNRLSDYLFVLSRQWTMDLKAKETPWKPRT